MKLGHALWAGLGVFLGVIVQSWAANADCVDDCDVSTYCDAQMHASGECLSRLQRCYQLECNKPKVVYGSIAYGEESTAWGYSFDMPDTASADRRALSGCAARGNDCKVVVNFENSCGALAAPTATSRSGAARAPKAEIYSTRLRKLRSSARMSRSSRA